MKSPSEEQNRKGLTGEVLHKIVVASPADAAWPKFGIRVIKNKLVVEFYGPVPIEKIKVGDEVLSRNQVTGKLEYKRVTNLTKPHSSKVIELHFGKVNSLQPTPEHPFFVKHVSFAISSLMILAFVTGEAPYSYDLFHLLQENGWLNIRRGVASIRENRRQRRAMSA